MIQYYDKYTLKNSEPFKVKKEFIKNKPESEFNKDSFELFKIHYPHLYVETSTGYRLIYKNSTHTERSEYNKIGSHWDAYYILINMTIGKMISEGIIKAIQKRLSDEQGWVVDTPTTELKWILKHNGNIFDPTKLEDYKKIIDYLAKNKDFFKEVLIAIKPQIERTTGEGNKAEIESETALRKMFGNDIEIKDTSGTGQQSDTLKGEDRVIIRNGKRESIQIKKASKVLLENGIYYIYYPHPKLYKGVDLMMFKDGTKFHLFRARDYQNNLMVRLFDYGAYQEGYMIPSQFLVKSIDLKS
jgi:hypothetical protein